MIEGAPRATTGLRGLLWIAQVRPFTVTENPPLRSKNESKKKCPCKKTRKEIILNKEIKLKKIPRWVWSLLADKEEEGL